MNRFLVVFIVGVVFAVAPAITAATSVFEVVVEKKSKETVRGVATLVADEVLVTSNALLSLGDKWGLDTGHDGRSLLAVTVLHRDVDSDIALITAPGLRGEVVSFASESLVLERMVDTLRRDGVRSNGVVIQVMGSSGFQHSAAYPDSHHGSVLVNRCGEIVGLNAATVVTQKRVFSRDIVGLAPPKIPIKAVALDRLKEVVGGAGVVVNVASEACLTLQQENEAARARAEADRAARQREADVAVETVRRANEQAQRDAQRARQAAETALAAQQKVEEAEERLRQIEQDAAREKAELEVLARNARDEADKTAEDLKQEQAKKKTLHQVVVGLGITALLIAVLGGMAVRRRSQALRAQRERTANVEEKLDKATLTFPDIFLQGAFPEGEEVRVKINGDALVRSAAGQVLGRDAEVCDVLLRHSEVSREHLKLQVVDGVLRVTDLESFNGSFLNGRALLPHVPVEVRNGDLLRVGTTELRVVISS